MESFFIVGTTAFWALIAFEFCLLMWFVEEEMYIPAWVSITLCWSLLMWLGNSNFLVYLRYNPVDVIMYVVVYFIVGVIWSFLKFYLSANDTRNKLKALRNDYNVNNFGKTWGTYLYDNFSYEDCRKLIFSTYSNHIIFWIIYWPVSALWTLINDPFRKAATWLYEIVLIGLYKRIFEHVIGEDGKGY